MSTEHLLKKYSALFIFLFIFLPAAQAKDKINGKDTNGDGKPDRFSLFVKGRELVLREADRNFDGKIDRRALQRWNGDKKIRTFINNRVSSIPTPGYENVWVEEDNDYDGKVDVYKEKGKKDAGNDRVGKPIDTRPTRPKAEPGASTLDKGTPA